MKQSHVISLSKKKKKKRKKTKCGAIQDHVLSRSSYSSVPQPPCRLWSSKISKLLEHKNTS